MHIFSLTIFTYSFIFILKPKKYTGVYYRVLENNDKAYDITYKEHHKKI